MAKFQVEPGVRYRAKILLEGFETWASNDMLKEKFENAGFTNVHVSGEDGDRTAEGDWWKEPTSAEMPEQVKSVEIVEL